MAKPILAHPSSSAVRPGTNVLKRRRFERPPIVLPKRKGRLPRGVISIKSVPRLKVGVLAEIVGSTIGVNSGKRVRITKFDPGETFCFFCRSLDGDVVYTDGDAGKTAWMRAKNLRRVWTGSTARSKAGAL